MKPYNFQEYELITYEKNKSTIYRLIVLILIIGIMYLISSYKFNIYDKLILYKEDSNYYLLMNINKNINHNKNSYLKIDNKEYKYKILNDIKYINTNGTIYKSIPITIDTDKELEEYQEIYYFIKSDTIINIIFRLLGGG